MSVHEAGNETLNLVISIIVIGIVMGIVGLILAQFQVTGAIIPQELLLDNYGPLIYLVVLILVIVVIVSIVFEYVIPTLRRTTAGGGR